VQKATIGTTTYDAAIDFISSQAKKWDQQARTYITNGVFVAADEYPIVDLSNEARKEVWSTFFNMDALYTSLEFLKPLRNNIDFHGIYTENEGEPWRRFIEGWFVLAVKLCGNIRS